MVINSPFPHRNSTNIAPATGPRKGTDLGPHSSGSAAIQGGKRSCRFPSQRCLVERTRSRAGRPNDLATLTPKAPFVRLRPCVLAILVDYLSLVTWRTARPLGGHPSGRSAHTSVRPSTHLVRRKLGGLHL